LQNIIERRFENSIGYDMVVKQEYALEDDCNGRIIDKEQPFEQAFRVKKKVNMNMLYTRRGAAIRMLLCPRCELPANVPDGDRVQWYDIPRL
jgi:hypothetical protein